MEPGDEVRRERDAPDYLVSGSFALGVCGCALDAINLKGCLVMTSFVRQHNYRSFLITTKHVYMQQLSVTPPRRAFNFCNSSNRSFVDSSTASNEDIETAAVLILSVSFALGLFYLIFFLWHACIRICCTRSNPEAPERRYRLHCATIIPLGCVPGG